MYRGFAENYTGPPLLGQEGGRSDRSEPPRPHVSADGPQMRHRIRRRRPHFRRRGRRLRGDGRVGACRWRLVGHLGGVVAVTALPTSEALAEARACLAMPRSPAEVRARLVASPPTLQCALGGRLLAWAAEGDGGARSTTPPRWRGRSPSPRLPWPWSRARLVAAVDAAAAQNRERSGAHSAWRADSPAGRPTP